MPSQSAHLLSCGVQSKPMAEPHVYRAWVPARVGLQPFVAEGSCVRRVQDRQTNTKPQLRKQSCHVQTSSFQLSADIAFHHRSVRPLTIWSLMLVVTSLVLNMVADARVEYHLPSN